MATIRAIHIGDLADNAGASSVASLVSSFSCPPNNEVETFLKKNALDFTRRSVSVTHLLVSPEDRVCLGYFTLTHKPFSVKAESLSNSQRKRMERFARYDAEFGVYTVSAFLIAQIGRNFSATVPAFGTSYSPRSIGFRQPYTKSGDRPFFLNAKTGTRNSRLSTKRTALWLAHDAFPTRTA